MRSGRSWRRGLALAALSALAVAAGGCGRGGEPDGAAAEVRGKAGGRLDPALAAHLPPGATMEMAERGRKLFVTCSVCHGPDAGGTQLGPSLRDREWVDIDGSPGEIERVIREGVAEPKKFPTPMPPMGGGTFDAEQVRDLVAYVYAISHSAPDARAAPDSTRTDPTGPDSSAARR